MNFNLIIDNIHGWYRESTREWVVSVNITTDNCSISIAYPCKTLNKARRKMFRSLPNDLICDEFEYRMCGHRFDNFFTRGGRS